MLRAMRRSFNFLDKESFNIIYKTYMRPHLEYCAQAWNPYFRKDIEQIEGVQRRATKLVKEIRGMPYNG